MPGKRNSCCVLGCGRTKLLHKFPSPTQDSERFRTWIFNIGGDLLGLRDDYIYKSRRVCHLHFEEKYKCRYSRVSNIAIPYLNIPGLKSHGSSSEGQQHLQNKPPRSPTPLPLQELHSNVTGSMTGSSVEKKALVVSESYLLHGEELSDDDGLDQPATEAASADGTQPATPYVDTVENDTTTIIFPLTDDFLTKTVAVPVPSSVTEIVTESLPAIYPTRSEDRPTPNLDTIDTKTAAQFLMEFSASSQISTAACPEFAGSSKGSNSAPNEEMEHDYCANGGSKRNDFTEFRPEMAAYYYKQWMLMRKKLRAKNLQLRRLRKRVETLEGRSREGAGKT